MNKRWSKRDKSETNRRKGGGEDELRELGVREEKRWEEEREEEKTRGDKATQADAGEGIEGR